MEEIYDKSGFPVRVFRTTDIKSITAGIPGSSHKHLRVAVETDGETMVFQEATVAAIVRAYIAVKTHPTCQGIRLEGKNLEPEDGRKPGYATWQLVESTDLSGSEIQKYLEDIVK